MSVMIVPPLLLAMLVYMLPMAESEYKSSGRVAAGMGRPIISIDGTLLDYLIVTCATLH